MLRFVKKQIEKLGNRTCEGIRQLGEIAVLFGKTIAGLVVFPPRRVHIIEQMYQIGVLSLPVVIITGGFTGMVMAVQSYYQFHKISMETAVGILVGLSMTNELGPVLTGLMVAGRVGASMSAELGTMKVSEQIDALYTLAVNPVEYLVVPRFVACVTLIPILTVFSILIGIIGGYLVGVKMLGINSAFFMYNLLFYTKAEDLCNGLIKSVYFAIIIAVISCYKGMSASGGAEGVGRVTTESVVVACMTILVSDFFLSIVLF